MQQRSEELKAAGIVVVGISYDSVDVLKKFSDANKISLPLLSDEGSKTIDAFGIRNKEMAGKGKFDGIPYPGTYVLDAKGVVRAKLFIEKYQERHPVDEVIEAAKTIGE